VNRLALTPAKAGIVCLAAMLATLAGCGNGSSSTSSGHQDLKILFSAPLSGDSAESGTAEVNGAKLAADEINAAGGIASGPHKGAKVVIVPVDDELSTQGATTNASKFVSDDSYFALAGFLDTGSAQASSVVAGRAHLGVVSAFGCGKSLTDEATNVLVICAAPDATARAAGSFVADRVPHAKIASISIDVPQLDDYYSSLKEVASARGLDWVSKQVYAPTATDYSTVVTNALSKSPDAVISGSLQASAGQILSKIRQSNRNVMFVDMLGEGWAKTFMDSAGANAVGSYTEDLADLTPSATHDATRAEFAKRYKGAMTTAAAHGYDSVKVIAEAAEAGADSRADLLKYARKVDVDGLTGPIQFTHGLRPDTRVVSISQITGTSLATRKVVAVYKVAADGTVTKSN
jgi:branched-chain amino acid transport system substrate-binding protein